jgi:hypothetical protein
MSILTGHPARSLTALAQRLGVSAADAATVVVPLEEEPAPMVTVPDVAPASPLLQGDRILNSQQ